MVPDLRRPVLILRPDCRTWNENCARRLNRNPVRPARWRVACSGCATSSSRIPPCGYWWWGLPWWRAVLRCRGIALDPVGRADVCRHVAGDSLVFCADAQPRRGLQPVAAPRQCAWCGSESKLPHPPTAATEPFKRARSWPAPNATTPWSWKCPRTLAGFSTSAGHATCRFGPCLAIAAYFAATDRWSALPSRPSRTAVRPPIDDHFSFLR